MTSEDILLETPVEDEEYDVGYLSPAELLHINGWIGNQKAKILLDCGAYRCLVRSKMVQPTSIIRGQGGSIVGIGENIVESSGVTDVEIKILDENFDISASVVENDSIKYDAILGLDFLRANKCRIDMSMRKFTFQKKDQSFVSIYIDRNDEIQKIVRQRVPVYCLETVHLRSDQVAEVPVSFSTDLDGAEIFNDPVVYFEGNSTDVETLSGVMSGHRKFHTVISRQRHPAYES